MNYKLRWLHAVILGVAVLIIGTRCLIVPLSNRLHQCRAAARELQGKLADARRNNAQDRQEITASRHQPQQNRQPSRRAFLSVIQALAHVNGARLLSVQDAPPHVRSPESGVVKIVLQGRFQSIAAFVHAMTEMHASMGLLDFLYRDKQAEMEMMMSNVPDGTTLPFYRQADNDPECRGEYPANVNFTDEQNMRLTNSLYTMRMTGYLASGAIREAILILKNGSVITVQAGMLLGLERGRVTSVNPAGVVVNVSSQKTKVVIKPFSSGA